MAYYVVEEMFEGTVSRAKELQAAYDRERYVIIASSDDLPVGWDGTVVNISTHV